MRKSLRDELDQIKERIEAVRIISDYGKEMDELREKIKKLEEHLKIRIDTKYEKI